MTDSFPSVAEQRPASDRVAARSRPASAAPPLWVDALLVLWLAGLVLVPFPQPGRLLSGDPLHYAAIAKSTLASGDWLDLRLGDQPYFNKPPLMFWLTMGAFKLFGANTFVAQSTGAAFGIAMLVATWALGCKLGDRRHGILAALALSTTYVFFKNASVLRLDAATALCVLGGIWAVWAGRRRPGLLPLFWITAALAVAFKGVAGLIGVPVLIVWSLLRRDAHPWKSLLFWSTLPVLPLLVLPWILHNLEHYPDLFASGWYQNNIELNLTTDRGKPPLAKYSSDLIREGWPWLPFLLHGVFLAARALWRGSREDRWTLPAAWIVGVMVPLLCMSAAFSRYVFPLLPASTFLVATSLLTLWPRFVGRRFYIGIASFLLVISVVFAVAGERMVKDRTPDIVRFYPWLETHGQAQRIYQLSDEPHWLLQSAAIFYLDRQVTPLPAARLPALLESDSSVAVLVLRPDESIPASPIAAGIHGETIQEGERFDLVLFTVEGESRPGG